MNEPAEFDRRYATEQLRRARHPLRRLVKHFYLNSILRETSGPTIDFGCGAGQLLRRLPAGSIGLEINQGLVEILRAEGLSVEFYNASTDDFGLSVATGGTYETLVMAHVLEHFQDAARVFRKLLRSCRRLGISKIVIVVPGAKGYRSDATHKTFVSRSFVEVENIESCEGYALERVRYFPLDIRCVGEVFVFHELIMTFRLVQQANKS